MVAVDNADWLAKTTADEWEQVFHATLNAGDLQGAEAALRVLAIKDPHRAQHLMDLTRMALTLVGEGDAVAEPLTDEQLTELEANRVTGGN